MMQIFLEVVENRGKIAIILVVCPGCSLMEKIKVVNVCPLQSEKWQKSQEHLLDHVSQF
jgi:hypothetical protein